MKRWILALIAFALLLGLTACASVPEDEVPAQTCDLEYDMGEYSFFADIFDQKPMDEWEAMGQYTVLLKGLHTPVVLEMDGLIVKTLRAYGQTLRLDQDAYQGYVGVEIEAAEDVLVIYQIDDYERSCWLLTEEKCYELHPKDGYSTTVHVRDDGTLGYHKSWGEYDTTFNQEEYAPLYYCTSRDDVLYQNGSAEIANGQLVLTPEKTVTADDEYDLEALFAEAKADGYAGEHFSRFETVDQALAANVNR